MTTRIVRIRITATAHASHGAILARNGRAIAYTGPVALDAEQRARRICEERGWSVESVRHA